MHDVLWRASHATGPEQIRHKRKVLGRLDDGGIVRQARFFALQGLLNLGAKPLVVAGFLLFGLELGNARG